MLLTAVAAIAVAALVVVLLGGDLEGPVLRLTPLAATLLILVTGLGRVVSGPAVASAADSCRPVGPAAARHRPYDP